MYLQPKVSKSDTAKDDMKIKTGLTKIAFNKQRKFWKDGKTVH